MIEGWVEPEYWLGTAINAESAKGEEVAVPRDDRTSRTGNLCEIFMRYDVATPAGSRRSTSSTRCVCPSRRSSLTRTVSQG